MVPLVGRAHAPHAPPLVVTVGEQRARVRLLVSAPQDELGDLVGHLAPDDVCAPQSAVQRPVGG